MKSLEATYSSRYSRFLVPAADKLETFLKDCLSACGRIDRVCTRAKSASRFMQKALKEEDGKPKYTDPLNQIQDQIGARVVTFYASDIERIAQEVRRYFRPIESK